MQYHAHVSKDVGGLTHTGSQGGGQNEHWTLLLSRAQDSEREASPGASGGRQICSLLSVQRTCGTLRMMKPSGVETPEQQEQWDPEAAIALPPPEPLRETRACQLPKDGLSGLHSVS